MVAISFVGIHVERLNMDNRRAKRLNKPVATKPLAPPVANRNPTLKKLTEKNFEIGRPRDYIDIATNIGVEITAANKGNS
ncbi:hypothetical protein GW17_00001218 [Ensete ventricosum]|nr:hypothetical protein GW17_00001218 [Ensete ventricosum]RZS23130.1 hypothetical protein BHM03_00055991 [Ensete ventricosum]